MRKERWQGKLLNNRWEDDDLNTGCFDWLSRWKTAPSHTIADVHDLYQQLLPSLWDIPLYVENTEVAANRIDARIVDKNEKKVIVIEMSCPWLENRQLKDLEKTQKYGPLRWELKRQFQDYKVTQHNIREV